MHFEPEVVIGSVSIVSVHSFYLLCSEFPTHGRDAGFKTESLNNFFQHRVLAFRADRRGAHFHLAGGIQISA
jgi:hypothetical protein